LASDERQLVVSDANEGVKAAASKVLTASWKCCRVHFMRNAVVRAEKSGRRVVSALIASAFAQGDAEAVRLQWRKVADPLAAIAGDRGGHPEASRRTRTRSAGCRYPARE
jgi:transposase-like protein